VARYLLITQRTSVLEREPRFVPQVRPCGRTVLKSRLKWSTTWWRGAGFYRRTSVDRWILVGGIDRFSIVYSSGFIVRMSVRANPDDWIVVDEVLIGGRIGQLIRFFVASFFWWPLETCSPSSWVGWSRSSSCTTLLIVEPGAQDHRHAPLFLFRSSSCAAVNDDVLNRNCMPVGNFSS
jgi:hypothetical protein